MKLADYLKKHDLKPTAFARMAQVQASTISRILAGKRSGLKVAEKIKEASGGHVTADDLSSAERGGA